MDDGDAGGGSFGKGSWRKAGYKDKIMEVQSAITSAAAGGSDVEYTTPSRFLWRCWDHIGT